MLRASMRSCFRAFEAGGHRGVFDADGKDPEIALSDLIVACRPSITKPLIAAGGIMNATDIRKALAAGVQAVQMGTAFLACLEAGTSAPYRARLLEDGIRNTRTSRVYSGRLARGIENRFMMEMERRMETVLPFPAQNKFTRDLRAASAAKGSSDFLSLWAGTNRGRLWQGPVRELIEDLFA
jgi:nitronate monooxygenase